MAYINNKKVLTIVKGSTGEELPVKVVNELPSLGDSEYQEGDRVLLTTDNYIYELGLINIDRPMDGYQWNKLIMVNGTLEIMENGEYDVSNNAYVNVNVAGSGGVEVPQVSNIKVDENGILTFDKPNLSIFEEQGAIITYLVYINGATDPIVLDTNTHDIFANLINGENTIAIKIRIDLISTGTETILEYEGSIVVQNIDYTYPKKDMRRSSCCAIGTDIYVIGGYQNDDIGKFDTITDTMEVLEVTLPERRANPIVNAVGTDIYIFGGCTNASASDNLNSICKLDTITNTITTLSVTIPTKLMAATSQLVGNYIYIFGGETTSINSGSKKIYKFDITTETITSLSATLTNSAKAFGSTVVGTDIYIFGGCTSSAAFTSSATGYNDIYKFDTVTEKITKLAATIPTDLGKQWIGVISIGEKIFCIGGNATCTTSLSACSDKISLFDIVTNTFTTFAVTLPYRSICQRCVRIGEVVYILYLEDPNNNYKCFVKIHNLR